MVYVNGNTSGNGRDKHYLQVEGSDITLNGQPILLKGASLGGWSRFCVPVVTDEQC